MKEQTNNNKEDTMDKYANEKIQRNEKVISELDDITKKYE